MKKISIFSVMLISLTMLLMSCGPSEVVVRERPVEPVYVRPATPGPGYVWVEGAWVRSGRSYVYRQGYWARPQYGRTYRPGYWVQGRRGWYYKQGNY